MLKEKRTQSNNDGHPIKGGVNDSDTAPCLSGPWVTVILVNYNCGHIIQSALDALAAQSMGDFRAVVIDNASSDGSADTLRLPDDRFKLIHAEKNLGFAAANNLAARDCWSPWIATLNPDAEPSPDWLMELRAATVRYPEVAMFGSAQLSDQPGMVDGFGDCYSVFGIPWRGAHGHSISSLPPHDIYVLAPCAAAALYRTAVFWNVGGFDEAFFCYLEDVDLGIRIRLAGYRCLQVRRAEVVHVGSAVTGKDSRFTLFFSYRNRIWMLLKVVPFPLVAMMLPLHVALTLVLLARARRAGRSVNGAMAGLLAGIGGLPRQWVARRRIQESNTVGCREFARMLSWNFRAMARREIVVVR